MSKVLFLGIPSHGHVNPTLGLVHELVKQGEEVVYFSSADFREKIEGAGAEFAAYIMDLDFFKMKKKGEASLGPIQSVISSADKIIADILDQIKDRQFDYMIHSVAFPFTRVIAQLLGIPTVSSLAIFAGIRAFLDPAKGVFPEIPEIMKAYQQVSHTIYEKYAVQMPARFIDLIFNKGDINLVYTSDYFAPDREFFDASYKFVGPPIYDDKITGDFPFEKLQDKKVIYVSLGTVFSNYNPSLYEVFFKGLADLDAIIVLAAYNVDLSAFDVPENFIVRNYVPQSAVLKYTDAAVTHAGMNSISDLVYNDIPFVAIPLGSDQPLLAQRAEELGATITLDANNLDPDTLRVSVEKVLNDPKYLENIMKISASFREAGGYEKAVEEIFKLKREKGINN